jgi:hypothetical protein
MPYVATHCQHSDTPQWHGSRNFCQDLQQQNAAPCNHPNHLSRTTRHTHCVALQNLAFGQLFTDHMLICHHTDAAGWQRPRIQPFGPLSIHPASQVLHYGMCCFEGMKAYLGADGRGRLFRYVSTAGPDNGVMQQLTVQLSQRSSIRALALTRQPPQHTISLCMTALT